MNRFFHPRNIAVAGASADEKKVTNNVIANLLEMGFEGGIFPVGKNGGEIFGIPIYRALTEIPQRVDLLVIIVPANRVPGLLREAGGQGIDRAVIISDGFNESGPDGLLLAQQIQDIARKHAIRFIGPNCQGVICANSGVCVPFAPLFRHQVKKGGVSIVSQSGSIGWIGASGLSYEMDGISKVASIGNKLDVNELDLLEYLIEDPETTTIVLYLESFSDGRKLFELAKHSEKPIVVFKANTGGEASRIALSHTAALASDDRVAGAALAQAGMLRARTTREMIEICKALYLPLIRGMQLVVMAGSGGLALIGEDTVRRQGMRMAQLPEELLREIAQKGFWKRRTLTNPVDLGGFFNNRDILNVVKDLLSRKEVDGAALSLFNTREYNSPLTCSRFIDRVEEISRELSKPVCLHFVSDHFPLAEIKMAKRFPVFDTMEDAVCALSHQWTYRKFVNRTRSAYPVMKDERSTADQILEEIKADPFYPNALAVMALVSAYGIRCEMPVTAVNLEEARLKAEGIGYPVVMKIWSSDISHKTDIGGVRVNIRDGAALDKAFAEILENARKQAKGACIQGVMLQKMVMKGMELVLGGKQDQDFGPVVMFGMGGIFVEALDDISFRLAPVCREEARELIEETGVFPILKGVRSKTPFDIQALVEALVRLSMLLADFPEIKELDLNPVKIFREGEGLTAVDGRIVLDTPYEQKSLA